MKTKTPESTAERSIKEIKAGGSRSGKDQRLDGGRGAGGVRPQPPRWTQAPLVCLEI